MEIADRATFPKHRPSAALTVTRPELLADGSDVVFRRMVHDALAFASRLQAVRDGFASLIDLTGIQYTILISIHHLQYEQDASISTVARHLQLSTPFVTNETNKLVSMALVEKFRDPDDGRRVILRTTPEAHSRLDRLAEVQGQVNDEHFAPLAEGDFPTFRRLVSELVGSTDRALALLAGLGARGDSPTKADATTMAISARRRGTT